MKHTPTTVEAEKANAETAADQTGQGATNGTMNDDGSNTVRNKNNPDKDMRYANDVEGHGDNKANTYDLVNASLNVGIRDANAKKAKLARDRAKKKQVIAIERGYYGEIVREAGDVFDVCEGETATWFEDKKSNKRINSAEDDLV